MPEEKADRLSLVFEGQWLHVAGLLVLLAGCYWATGLTTVQAGDLWGISTTTWFWIAIFIAILHQVYVWFCWRLQLHGQYLTQLLGKPAFQFYATGFVIIAIPRVISVWLLAIANQGGIDFTPALLKTIALIAAVPVVYLFYSIRRYFSFSRAFGSDHFDPAIGNLPFVRQGIFRFTPNSMYVFGFLLAWIPAFWWLSPAALVAALFNHLYIWIHYFATEKPDFAHIYDIDGRDT